MKKLFSRKGKDVSPEPVPQQPKPAQQPPLPTPTQPETHQEDVDMGSEEEKDTLRSLHRSSLFSTRRTLDTFSTTPTSHPSTMGSSSSSKRNKGLFSSIDNIGKPLRVMPADKYSELSRTSTSASVSMSSTADARQIRDRDEVERELEMLTESLSELVDQVQQSVINVSSGCIRLVELMDASVPYKVSPQLTWNIEESGIIRSIIKICLQFHDTYLRGEVYNESRALVKRSLAELLTKLNFPPMCEGFDTVPYFHNYAISNTEPYPVQSKLTQIMDRIVQSSSSNTISDQDGAFIAPILRGLTRQTAVLTIMFGFPEPQQEHYEVANALFQTFSDVHFCVSKNMITPASAKFTPPFTVPVSPQSPQLSLSISATEAVKTSGTLGGFITPRIGRTADRALLKYKGSNFALTCAHVLLSEDQDYPDVQVPSAVLLNAYRSALTDERDKYPQGSEEHDAYSSELVKTSDYAVPLGSVIWGERIVQDHTLSDVAIVKLNQEIQPKNTLGDDADQYAPALKFSNEVKRVVKRSEFNSYTKVFKVGAATKYTTGMLNGLKMVYWLRGALQTSEFVVGSGEPMFCNGGDSGALILTDLERERGLGCVGMLHSYDGEGKQFGLFTPMEAVMSRLRDVTGVEWGFV